jgi:peroxiredoxin
MNLNQVTQDVHPIMQTFEMGPNLDMEAPDFTVLNHAQQPVKMSSLMGRNGLILGFIGDIWQSANIRRIIWLQRHANTFIRSGHNVALLIRDEPHMLYGFYVSSPTPPEFPLLADLDDEIHRLFNMSRFPGMVLVDKEHIIRHKWLMPDERVWPKIQEIAEVLQALDHSILQTQ